MSLAEGVEGYLPQKDFQNSNSDSNLEEGLEMEVVIANLGKKDREIILSLRALEKAEEEEHDLVSIVKKLTTSVDENGKPFIKESRFATIKKAPPKWGFFFSSRILEDRERRHRRTGSQALGL